jgi:SAM-dependent methyltransferase
MCAFEAADYPWLAIHTTVEDYVEPQYYERLLRPYVFFCGEANEVMEDIELLRTHILGELERRPVRDILELGIGTGRATDAILELVAPCSYHAVDLSPRMIASCREKYRGYERMLHLSQDDAISYLLDCDRHFDMACCLWSFSHAVHQNILNRADGAQRVELAIRRLLTELLRPNGTFFLIHVDTCSPEQRILVRQWNRVMNVFDEGLQSPSKQHVDTILARLSEEGKVSVVSRRLVGQEILYSSLEKAMEIFLNFHLESHFNDRPDLPEVYRDVEQHLSQHLREDGTVAVAPGCFVYEISRTG